MSGYIPNTYNTIHSITYLPYPTLPMPRSKTGPFWINHVLDIDNTTSTQASLIDISAYVDAGDSQGLEVMSVDYIWYNSSTKLPITNGGTDFVGAVQLKDNSTDSLVHYDNLHLVSSAQLYYESAGTVHLGTDVFPDRLMISKAGGRVTVNDALEIAGKTSAGVDDLSVCVRIQARVVNLTKRDYMTLALQTVADN